MIAPIKVSRLGDGITFRIGRQPIFCNKNLSGTEVAFDKDVRPLASLDSSHKVAKLLRLRQDFGRITVQALGNVVDRHTEFDLMDKPTELRVGPPLIPVVICHLRIQVRSDGAA